MRHPFTLLAFEQLKPMHMVSHAAQSLPDFATHDLPKNRQHSPRSAAEGTLFEHDDTPAAGEQAAFTGGKRTIPTTWRSKAFAA